MPLGWAETDPVSPIRLGGLDQTWRVSLLILGFNTITTSSVEKSYFQRTQLLFISTYTAPLIQSDCPGPSPGLLICIPLHTWVPRWNDNSLHLAHTCIFSHVKCISSFHTNNQLYSSPAPTGCPIIQFSLTQQVSINSTVLAAPTGQGLSAIRLPHFRNQPQIHFQRCPLFYLADYKCRVSSCLVIH